MSTDPSGVLASIDSALADFGLSEDAMRWTPEPQRVICDGGKLWPEPPVLLAGLDLIPGTDEWPALPAQWAHVSSRCTLEPIAGRSITIQFTHGPRATSLIVDEALPDGLHFEWVSDEAPNPVPYRLAKEDGHRLTVEICKAFGVPLRAVSDHNHPRPARCRECNPAGNAPPLAAKYKPGPKASRMRGRQR